MRKLRKDMKRIEGRIDTVLAQWLRAATKEQREELADRAKTSVEYLRLLAGVHRENPKIRLSMDIVKEANNILPDLKNGGRVTPVLSLQDLADPTRYGSD